MSETLAFSDLESVFLEARPQIERVLTRRTGQPALAADLTQDLYLRLQHIAAPLPNRHEARAYLFRMAANLLTDHWRTETRRAELLSGLTALFEGIDNSPENGAFTKDEFRRVEAALAELSPRAREWLYMSRVLGMTLSEIATQKGVSRSLVEMVTLDTLKHCRARVMAQDVPCPCRTCSDARAREQRAQETNR